MPGKTVGKDYNVFDDLYEAMKKGLSTVTPLKPLESDKRYATPVQQGAGPTVLATPLHSGAEPKPFVTPNEPDGPSIQWTPKEDPWDTSGGIYKNGIQDDKGPIIKRVLDTANPTSEDIANIKSALTPDQKVIFDYELKSGKAIHAALDTVGYYGVGEYPGSFDEIAKRAGYTHSLSYNGFEEPLNTPEENSSLARMARALDQPSSQDAWDPSGNQEPVNPELRKAIGLDYNPGYQPPTPEPPVAPDSKPWRFDPQRGFVND